MMYGFTEELNEEIAELQAENKALKAEIVRLKKLLEEKNER